MLTSIVSIERSEGRIIPFEYNYYLAISVYSKLKVYQDEIKPLHHKNQPGIHTISNIITKDSKRGDNGLDIPKGFFILRSIDKRIGSYLRLGISVDPNLRIVNTKYTVKMVSDSKGRLNGNGDVKFRTLSPVLVRNFENKDLFVDEPQNVESNLNSVTKWTLKNQFGLDENSVNRLYINVKEAKSKTVRISGGPAKESMTRAFELTGNISGEPGTLEIIYHRGMGSKTGLGLGCWEVV